MVGFLARFRGEGAPRPPRAGLPQIALAFVGAALTIFVLRSAHSPDAMLLLGSFGASCMLCFGAPDAPFSQPRNVVLGHVLCTAIGVASLQLLGPSPWSLALGVGAACAAMMTLRIVHPPAASNPIIVHFGGHGWSYVLLPTAAGAALLVVFALLFHAATRPGRWPKSW
ncbi:MAG: HPP family protein [Phycisphaerales bacterium]|jgi:CBS-domain-containing membrane protein|nr:HPP family protein [Phycisphaerales bacterium]